MKLVMTLGALRRLIEDVDDSDDGDALPPVSDDEGTLIPEAFTLSRLHEVAKGSAAASTFADNKEAKAAVSRFVQVTINEPMLFLLACEALGKHIETKRIKGTAIDFYRYPVPKQTLAVSLWNNINAVMKQRADPKGVARNVWSSAFVDKFNAKIASIYAKELGKLVAAVNKTIESLPSIKKKIAALPGKSSDPLGRFAFALNRAYDQKSPPPPPEPDTPVEKKLYDAIAGHYSDNVPMKVTDAEALKSLIRRDMYNDVIKEPHVTNVYRGMSVGAKWLAKALKLKSTAGIPGKGKLQRAFKFVPRKGASTSWTTDRNVALRFSKDSVDRDNQYGIIMVASVEENPNKFLSGPDGTYKLDVARLFDREKEATALGPVKVSSVDWELQYYKEPDEKTKPKNPYHKSLLKKKKEEKYGY